MLNRPTRGWAGAVVMVLVTLVAGVYGGTANASEAENAGGRYLALGDSVAFGYSPLLEDPWIPERFVGYPEVIEKQSRLTTTNLACPGQTAQALISRTAVDNGCFDARQSARQAGFVLLHTDYRGTQLQAALEAVRSSTPPSLISIQGGGNEVVICAFDRHPQRCLDDFIPKVADSLSYAATQLRAAGYQDRLVLVGYHLVPGVEPQLRRLNRAIDTRGAPIGRRLRRCCPAVRPVRATAPRRPLHLGAPHRAAGRVL